MNNKFDWKDYIEVRNTIDREQEESKMKYDLPNGWTCIACGKEYLKDTTGKQVADYSEGTMCDKCRKENINDE